MRRGGKNNGKKSEMKQKATASGGNMRRAAESVSMESGSCSSSEDKASSCVSSEFSQDESSPESVASTSMVLVGCPRCLMYVMVAAETEPRCPQCKSSVLLDLEDTNQNKNERKKTKN